MTDLGHGRGWATADLVASVHRIDAELGRPLQITSAGRTPAEQQTLRDRWDRGDRVGIAFQPATPAASPHVKGLAIDSDDHAYLAGPKGQAHGFTHPIANDYPHFVYDHSKDKTGGAQVDTTPSLANPFAAFTPIAQTLSDRNTWIRIGIGAIGVGLLTIAIARIFNASELGQEIIGPAKDGIGAATKLAKLAVTK